MARLICFLSGIALLAAPAGVSASIVTGPVTVIDGDTLDMTGMRIRLLGIDAPEARQSCTRAGEPWACGAEASEALRAITAGQALTCEAKGSDAYGRTLAICRTRVLDVGREMVRRGLALALDEAAPAYREAEALAQSLKFGLWGATFQTPRDWRAAHAGDAPARQDAPSRSAARRPPAAALRTVATRSEAGGGACTIKGNRNARGEWIYHLPGQAYYHRTRPEALFCSEREAMAAGYRRSKV